jgi:hypothetical protein
LIFAVASTVPGCGVRALDQAGESFHVRRVARRISDSMYGHQFFAVLAPLPGKDPSPPTSEWYTDVSSRRNTLLSVVLVNR